MFHIIIPTYNRENLILNALKSVINQTNDNWIIYIIDDWSTDNTEEILKPYIDNTKILYTKKNNWWVWSARNIWIEQALEKSNNLENDYIIFLDDDDLLKESSLDDIWNILKNTNYKDIYWFSCEDQYWNKITQYKKEFNNKEIEFLKLFCSNIWEWFLVFKSIIFTNKEYRFREDINWWEAFLLIKLWEKFKYYIFDEVFRIYGLIVKSVWLKLVNFSHKGEKELV